MRLSEQGRNRNEPGIYRVKPTRDIYYLPQRITGWIHCDDSSEELKKEPGT